MPLRGQSGSQTPAEGVVPGNEETVANDHSPVARQLPATATPPNQRVSVEITTAENVDPARMRRRQPPEGN